MIGNINTLEQDKFEETNGGQVSVRVFSKEKVLQLVPTAIKALTFDSITASKVSDTVIRYTFANGASKLAFMDMTLNADNTYSITSTINGDKMLLEDGSFLLLETGDTIIL